MQHKYLSLGLVAILSVLVASQVSFSQDDDTTGSFIYRDADGNDSPMMRVRTSEQAARTNAELAEINEQLTEITNKLDFVVGSIGATTVPDPQPDAIDINTATFEELQSIPGIGPAKAGAIVAERGSPDAPSAYRPFSDWGDFAQRVNGVGPATVSDIQASGRATIDNPGN